MAAKYKSMQEAKNIIEESLKDDMNQRWRQDSYSQVYKDQYGFKIHYGTNKKYIVEWRGIEPIKVYSLTAAQMISRIILNDAIKNK